MSMTNLTCLHIYMYIYIYTCTNIMYANCIVRIKMYTIITLQEAYHNDITYNLIIQQAFFLPCFQTNNNNRIQLYKEKHVKNPYKKNLNFQNIRKKKNKISPLIFCVEYNKQKQ